MVEAELMRLSSLVGITESELTQLKILLVIVRLKPNETLYTKLPSYKLDDSMIELLSR